MEAKKTNWDRHTVPNLGRFTAIWVGQLVSLLGSGLTNFIIGVWVYQRTGSVTRFTLIAVFAVLPSIIILPWAGVFTDRWDRRWLMICCNAGAGLSTLFIALFLFAGRLEIWHTYLGVTVIATFATVLNLIYTTTLALLVPKQQLSRFNGMIYTAQAASHTLPPMLAGVLMSRMQIYGLVLVDFATYLFAILTLLVVRFSAREITAEKRTQKASLLREIGDGWSFIKARSGFMALLIYFATINFVFGIARILFTPMILSFASIETLGMVLSISGFGFLLGSIVLSFWGGPKNRIQGVLGFGSMFGVSVMLVGLRPSIMLAAIASFLMYSLIPLLNGCSQAIWLVKTPIAIQGRVFSVRWMIGLSTTPLAYLIAGPLADNVFEPLMAGSDLLQKVFGTGRGRGIGLMFVVAGFLTILTQLAGLLYPRLMQIEQELPDTISNSAIQS